jgi:hypothetical protein
MPGGGFGGLTKDDERNRGHLQIPPIHVGHVPSFRPAESTAGEFKALAPIAEAHPSFRPFTGVSAAGKGFSKWIGGSLAGLGAAIAAFFRAIFGSGSKENGAR